MRLIRPAALNPVCDHRAFRCTPEFQASGVEPSRLYMPVGDDRAYQFAALPQAIYRRLPAMPGDTLPGDSGLRRNNEEPPVAGSIRRFR